jgi:hypothetical protein
LYIQKASQNKPQIRQRLEMYCIGASVGEIRYFPESFHHALSTDGFFGAMMAIVSSAFSARSRSPINFELFSAWSFRMPLVKTR